MKKLYAISISMTRRARALTFRNQNFVAVAIVTLFTILVIITFLTTDKGLSLEAYQGPLYFWIQNYGLYVTLGFAGLSVFLVISQRNRGSLYFAIILVALGAFLVKLLIPYYIFDGLVHYDIFSHYLNVKILASQGLQQTTYQWPNAYVLADVFEQITGTHFPLSISLVTLTSSAVLPLLLFGFVKKLFGSYEGVLSVLLLVLVEPFSMHYSPYTITISIIFLSFVSFFYSIYSVERRCMIISVIAALSSILYHPFLPVILGIMLISVVCCLALLSRFSSVRVRKPSIYFASVTLMGTVCWWLYVSFSVFRQLVTSVEGYVIGGPIPLVGASVLPSLPEIVGQFEVINVLSTYTRFIVLLPPVILVLFWALHLMVRNELNIKYTKILSLASVTIILGCMGIVLTPVGYGDRFTDIFMVLLTSLSGICMLEVVRKKGFRKVIYKKVTYRKVIYVLFATLFISAVIISPITKLSSYVNIYYNGITSADERTGTFTATHLVGGQNLTGDRRLTSIARFFTWPNLLFSSSEFESNLNNGSFEFSSSVIVISSATANYVVVHGVSDEKAAKYVAELPGSLNFVYYNCYDRIFTP